MAHVTRCLGGSDEASERRASESVGRTDALQLLRRV